LGDHVTKTSFTEQDYSRFKETLDEQLDIFKEVINAPNFGSDPLMIGAELEVYLIDDDAVVSPKAPDLLAALKDDQFQNEINTYNLELNLSPQSIAGKPFTALLAEMRAKTDNLEKVAAQNDVNIIPIGILPTLKEEHLQRGYMTDEPRYEVIDDQLQAMRGRSFEINIQGEEKVQLSCDDVTTEGANTSFQVHMMVEHERFADIFNAAQLTMPFVVAVAANSSVLLGNRAWDESRIALFKQSLDVRVRDEVNWREPARVSFGRGWVRRDAWELYAETVALYQPILPITYGEPTRDQWQHGKLPKFRELALHMGTIWPWNRPVYSNKGNGHVRIEFRAIPAGPTSLDMVANAAFAIGMAVGMADTDQEYLASIPHNYAEYNFYRAAQDGMDAKVLWPLKNLHLPEEVSLTDVLPLMLKYAKTGLKKLSVDDSEIELYLGVIEKRIASGITGARWQRYTHRYLEDKYDKDKASRMLVELYIENARSCVPVSEWEKIWL